MFYEKKEIIGKKIQEFLRFDSKTDLKSDFKNYFCRINKDLL